MRNFSKKLQSRQNSVKKSLQLLKKTFVILARVRLEAFFAAQGFDESLVLLVEFLRYPYGELDIHVSDSSVPVD